MLNGDEALPSINLTRFFRDVKNQSTNQLTRFLLFNENAHAKDEHICDKNGPCFKRSYSLLRHILVQLQITMK